MLRLRNRKNTENTQLYRNYTASELRANLLHRYSSAAIHSHTVFMFMHSCILFGLAESQYRCIRSYTHTHATELLYLCRPASAIKWYTLSSVRLMRAKTNFIDDRSCLCCESCFFPYIGGRFLEISMNDGFLVEKESDRHWRQIWNLGAVDGQPNQMFRFAEPWRRCVIDWKTILFALQLFFIFILSILCVSLRVKLHRNEMHLYLDLVLLITVSFN